MPDPDAAAQQRQGKTLKQIQLCFGSASDGRAQDQLHVYPASVATTQSVETLTQPNSTSEHCILLYTRRSLDACTCVCGTDGSVKGGEGGSDHILAAVPADTASCRWNLAGDPKLFTHLP